MRRADALPQATLLLAWLALTVLAGCGDRGNRGTADTPLTFERMVDTAGLSRGAPIVEDFEAYRMPGGSLRIKAHVHLPYGTMMQFAVRRAEGRAALVTTQLIVQAGEIESPPLMSASGPLPVGPYRFELTAQFTTAWQTPAVLRATNDGKALRGPGITRTRIGGAMFWQVEEMTR